MRNIRCYNPAAAGRYVRDSGYILKRTVGFQNKSLLSTVSPQNHLPVCRKDHAGVRLPECRKGLILENPKWIYFYTELVFKAYSSPPPLPKRSSAGDAARCTLLLAPVPRLGRGCRAANAGLNTL